MATVTAYNGYPLNMLDLDLSRLSTGFIICEPARRLPFADRVTEYGRAE